jgi:acyl carrier protein
MEPIESQVREIIAGQIGHITDNQMVPEAELVRDLGADSLDVELIRGEIEEHFEVDVTDEALEKLKTLGDVVNLVRELKAKAQ